MTFQNKRRIYLINGNKVLVFKQENLYQLPSMEDFEAERYHNLQKFGIDSEFLIAGLKEHSNIPERFCWLPVREVTRNCKDKTIRNSAFATYQFNWDLQTTYCGRCGAKTEYSQKERAKVCPVCNLVVYPRISPAMIVAIVKDGELLLAHNSKFRAGFYSVLAGFMNQEETFEDCVKREVKEEVGISLKNIRYFGNQPWPYPDSHMVAFTAEYASGEIVVDNDEILSASWFKPDQLPDIPGKESISRALIDWFVDNYS